MAGQDPHHAGRYYSRLRLTSQQRELLLHHEEFPVYGVVSLIQQRAAGRHLGVCEHRIPARLLVLEPMANALTMVGSNRGGDVVGKAAESLAQRHHPQAFALAPPVQQGVELRTQPLADWSRHAH
ncbi:MAG TPA: hypothetical protein VLQ80_19820 [Candidatus Saccharimonadia bacterium]|nr:hypothetical protein [Candidatus Saccharimonadia bacterium]